MTSVEPLAAPFRAYDRVQRRRPYTTQLLSSVCIYFLGDLSAQMLNPDPPSAAAAAAQPSGGRSVPHPPSPPAALPPSPPITTMTTPAQPDVAWPTFSPLRSLRAITIGGLFSLPSYHWFLFLSSTALLNVPSRPLLSLASKVLVQQALFAPVFNTYFFGAQSLLSGDTWREAVERVKRTVPESWRQSCRFWPVVTAGIFWLVRPRHRSVAAGVVAIGWQTYLGVLNQRAAREVGRGEG